MQLYSMCINLLANCDAHQAPLASKLWMVSPLEGRGIREDNDVVVVVRGGGGAGNGERGGF